MLAPIRQESAVKALLLLFLAAMPTGVSVSWGGEAVTHIGDYTIQNWQVEQGLPQVSVTSIAQTPDGYLWLGTFNGLVRFDGVRFTVFHEGNTPALGNSGVTYLQVDERGALWMVTMAGGLVRLADGRFTPVLQEEAQCLLKGAGRNDRLFLLDRRRRCRQIEGDKVLPPEPPASSSNAAPSFVFANTCASWIEEQGKLFPSSQRTVPVFMSEGGNQDRLQVTIHSAAPSRAGGYWVATSNGIYRLRDGRLSTRVALLPPTLPEPLMMQEDGQGSLWAGKWAVGIFRLDKQGGWQQFSTGTGLEDNNVNCLFRDREGSLWVGTGQGGLHRIGPRVFQVYHTESGPNVIMSVTQDRQGRMWFGVNGGGLHTWAGGKLQAVTKPADLRNYLLAYSVLADRLDAIWIGLYGLKALRWKADAVTSYDLNDGSGQVMTPEAMFEDRTGAVWLGCTHGLLRYENGRFTRYTRREGLSSETIVALAEDRAGTLYIGTDGGGLNCLRQGRFACLTEADGLADNHVASLYVDDEDTLWIGTVNGGLGRYRQGRFHTAGVKDGLPTDNIGKMMDDGLGNLWLGSNRGLIRVNRRALNEYLDGQRSSVPWQVFGLSDGLSTLGCAGTSQPGFCNAQDGKLWFATIKGVAVTDPKHIPLNRLPPPVVIEEVVLDDKTMRQSQWSGVETQQAGAEATEASALAPRPSPLLTVPPRTHRVEFHFTGLSLMAPEKVRFRYRLEAFDTDWIEAGTRRIAYYSGVRPGKYQFHVTACNNDGVWNEAGATLGVVVLPPWWLTWWFRTLTVISAACLVLGWYELRLHRLRREQEAQESFSRRLIAVQESERQRLAGELHDGMGQDLLVIASQAQLGLGQEGNPAGTVAQLRGIAETAKQAVRQARRMAHNLRPGLLEELGFTKAARASLEKAGQASGMIMAIHLAEVDGLLPAEFEVNLFRIIQESLNNILKHARASEVRITLSKEPSMLRLLVEDNGCGFELSRVESAPPAQRGFGLRQIAERAKMMRGRVRIQSRPGQGTRLTVEVPIESSSVRARA